MRTGIIHKLNQSLRPVKSQLPVSEAEDPLKSQQLHKESILKLFYMYNEPALTTPRK